MATRPAALAAIERWLGFPQARSRTIARRLVEAGALTPGTPGRDSEFTVSDFVTIVLTLAACTELHEAAAAAPVYRGLVREGIPPSVLPETLCRSAAGICLESIAGAAIEDDLDLRGLEIEVDCAWPGVTLAWADGTTERFRESGSLASHWGGPHRRATIMPGNAFGDAARAIFGDK